jgi:hypothetical protein
MFIENCCILRWVKNKSPCASALGDLVFVQKNYFARLRPTVRFRSSLSLLLAKLKVKVIPMLRRIIAYSRLVIPRKVIFSLEPQIQVLDMLVDPPRNYR